MRDAESVAFAVGAEAFEMERGSETVVERKVKLPVRWLKGFVEVQAYQARMQHCWEISGLEAHRFFRSLPRSAATATGWAAPAGRGLRLSQAACKDGGRIVGIQRPRVLEDLAGHAKTFRGHQAQGSLAHGLEPGLPDAQFTAVFLVRV